MDRLPAEAEKLCANSPYDFSDLSAVFINYTLKRSPEVSNTEGLADMAMTIMRRTGVAVELVNWGLPCRVALLRMPTRP